jgi:hypothetical protein
MLSGDLVSHIGQFLQLLFVIYIYSNSYTSTVFLLALEYQYPYKVFSFLILRDLLAYYFESLKSFVSVRIHHAYYLEVYTIVKSNLN